MEEKDRKEGGVNFFIALVNKSRVGQFLFLFVLLIALFYCVEILKLHFGQTALPLNEIIVRIKRRLPLVCSIAAIASLYVISRRRPPKR